MTPAPGATKGGGAEESILVGGCQGLMLIPADQYPEYLRGTRYAAYLGLGVGMIYGLVFVLFLND